MNSVHRRRNPLTRRWVLVSPHRMQRPWQWGIAALLLAVSIASAVQCAEHPWQTNTEWTTRIFGKSL